METVLLKLMVMLKGLVLLIGFGVVMIAELIGLVIIVALIVHGIIELGKETI